MYETLKSKIETIASGYADLVDTRIRRATKNELDDGTAMTEINDGIRMLNHIAATLERIDRLHRGNDASGLNNAATIIRQAFIPAVEVSQSSTTEENYYNKPN